MKALLSRKIGMTTLTADNGRTQAVTLLSVSPNVVTSYKTEDKDGYSAIQVGTQYKKELSKSRTGHLKNAGKAPKVLREFRIKPEDNELQVGAELGADLFSVGDTVQVSAISKGKGFAGTIKRHGFQRGPKTHGGRNIRKPGSIGSMYPQKIFKGKRMSGHMGHQKTTIKNLKVALVDVENKLIGVTGAVPGPNKALVSIVGDEK